jgi:ribonuclease E
VTKGLAATAEPDTQRAEGHDKAVGEAVAAKPDKKSSRRRGRKRAQRGAKLGTPESESTVGAASSAAMPEKKEAPAAEATRDVAAPAKKRPAKRRARKGRRRSTARAQPAEARVSEAAERTVGSSAPSVTPLSADAQVETKADAVVIRFPPAVPEPALPELSGPSEEGEPEEVLPAIRQAEAIEEAAAVAAGLADQEEQPAASEGPLSPSQKRRLRRKRRAEALRESGKSAATEQPAAQPGAEPEAPAAMAPAPAEVVPDRPEPEEPEEKPKKRRRPRRRGKVKGPAAEVEDPPAPEPATAEAPAAELLAAKRVKKEMIINVVPREECRIAILEHSKLEEIYLERASTGSHVGNIYKGVVTNVEASIQAAFIDFGLGKNGFLHISDLHPQHFPDREGQTENVGRKTPHRRRPPIQRCLRRGEEVIVQITKEGIGTKGPTLSTYLAIPGRFMVMMPGMRRLGVSRRIEDEDIRHKLREQLGELELPEEMGFIARTAAEGRTKRELQTDLNYLTRLWKAVEKRTQGHRAPAEVYRESDLVIRTIRDVFTTDIERILVDDAEVAERAREFLAIFSPRSHDTVVEYDAPEPIFHKYGIEAELERLHSRHVPLKSGGSLVIDPTEALVAIDVNSGRFRTEQDAETTAYKINLEAADEIPRQLRLRDVGGVIICDFIDMRRESHRREIERRLVRNLKQHKERAKILRMSAFGIIEMTRQRQRASLTRSVYQDCHHCRGTGLLKSAESVALDVMRLLQLAVTREHIHLIEVSISPEVADLLQNRKRALIHEFETRYRRTISIRPGPNFGLDQVQIQCYDHRGRLVPQP